MRKLGLCLTVVVLTSCSLFDRDLWSAYDSLPLELETLENFDLYNIYNYKPLEDDTYFVSRSNDEGSYDERCSAQDDSVLYTFPVSSYGTLDVALAGDALYTIAVDYFSSPDLSKVYKLSRMDDVTMEVENAITFDFEDTNMYQVLMISGDSSLFLVFDCANPFIQEYSYNLELISTTNFSISHEEPGVFSSLTDLSSLKTTLVDGDNIYFVLSQTLFRIVGTEVIQLPYNHVMGFESFESGSLTFLQYVYVSKAREEYFDLFRITINATNQEIDKEKIFAIGNAYLSNSAFNKEESALLFAFTFYQGDLFIFGKRKIGAFVNNGFDTGILRLDLESLDVSSYFKSDETTYADVSFYYNGHYVYECYATDIINFKQINLSVLSE